MFTLTRVLIPVALLSSVVFGLPLVEDSIFDGVDFPPNEVHLPVTENDRIYGGKEAKIGQFKYQISLRLAPPGAVSKHLCGGSIITNRFVVTAAHCFIEKYPKPSFYFILAGAHRNDPMNGTEYTAERWIVHERFHINMTLTNATVINDIALVKTVSPIQFNNLVAPIPLHHKFFSGGAPAVISGWGETNVSLNLNGKRKLLLLLF